MLAGLAIPFLLWASSLAFVIAEGAPEDPTSGEIIVNLILQIVVLDGIFIGVPLLFALGRYRAGWQSLGFFGFKRELWWWPIVAAAGAHVGIVAYSLILVGIGGDGAVPEQEGIDDLFDSRAVLPLVGLALVIMAPLAEELFFRGFVFAGLAKYVGVVVAMAISGFIFSLFHVTSVDTLSLLFPFTMVGVLFAWLYYRSGTLWMSIGTHFVFNLFSFILLATGAASS